MIMHLLTMWPHRGGVHSGHVVFFAILLRCLVKGARFVFTSSDLLVRIHNLAYGWFPDKYDEFQISNLGSSVNGELDYGTLPDMKPLTQGMIPALAKLMKDQEKEYREVLVMDRAGREYYIGTLFVVTYYMMFRVHFCLSSAAYPEWRRVLRVKGSPSPLAML